MPRVPRISPRHRNGDLVAGVSAGALPQRKSVRALWGAQTTKRRQQPTLTILVQHIQVGTKACKISSPSKLNPNKPSFCTVVSKNANPQTKPHMLVAPSHHLSHRKHTPRLVSSSDATMSSSQEDQSRSVKSRLAVARRQDPLYLRQNSPILTS